MHILCLLYTSTGMYILEGLLDENYTYLDSCLNNGRLLVLRANLQNYKLSAMLMDVEKNQILAQYDLNEEASQDLSLIHIYHNISGNHVSKYWFHFSALDGETDIFRSLPLPYCINVSEKDQSKISQGFKAVALRDGAKNITDILLQNYTIMDLSLIHIFPEPPGQPCPPSSRYCPCRSNILLLFCSFY